LRLGARGSHQGEPFVLLGRLQLAYQDEDGAQGRWTEWHALFDSGRSACLSEDNGAYVFSLLQTPWDAPQSGLAGSAELAGLAGLAEAPLGGSVIMAGKSWSLASRVQAHVHAMEGELDHLPDLKASFLVIELRSTSGEVLSIEPGATPPRFDIGQSVALPDLKLSGIADEKDVSEAKLKAKGIECPNCGASVTPLLTESRSITCGSCKSVIDLSKGLGADLACYQQDNALLPLIPLGTVGRLLVQGRNETWQVVGYQERCEVDVEAREEQVFWREYLLYNKARGFAFLVDAEDGWSIVRPLAGVPSSKGDLVMWDSVSYKKRYSYNAKTTYVLGEFYWPVHKDQRTLNTDFHSTGGSLVLNREQSRDEVTWSMGEILSADEVAKAFRIKESLGAFQRDVKPWRQRFDVSLIDVWIILIVVIFFVALSSCSDDDDCGEVKGRYGEASNEYKQCLRDNQRSGSYRGSSGSSYGGYSSGGSHK
jgi:ribosomal protein S27AE